jgi:hypothetical protein
MHVQFGLIFLMFVFAFLGILSSICVEDFFRVSIWIFVGLVLSLICFCLLQR